MWLRRFYPHYHSYNTTLLRTCFPLLLDILVPSFLSLVSLCLSDATHRFFQIGSIGLLVRQSNSGRPLTRVVPYPVENRRVLHSVDHSVYAS